LTITLGNCTKLAKDTKLVVWIQLIYKPD